MDIVPDLLSIAKAVQKSRIRAEFERAPSLGFTVTAGYTMDSRQADIDNLSRLRDQMIRMNTASTSIRDKSNALHTVTLAQLTTIITEMEDFSIGLRTRKWARETAIDAATTPAELIAVIF